MADEGISRRSMLSGAILAAGAGVAGFLVARNSSLSKPKAVATSTGSGYSSGGASPASTTAPASPATSPGGAPASSTPSSAPPGKPLVALDKVPASGGLILDGQQIVLTKDSSGNVHGFSAVCTHQGCLVGSVANGKINCPCHGSVFNAWTGAVVQGPATDPLPAVKVVVSGNEIFKV